LSLANRFVSPLESATEWARQGDEFHAEMRAVAAENPPTFLLNSPLEEWNLSTTSWLRYYGWQGEFIIGENACCLTDELLRR